MEVVYQQCSVITSSNWFNPDRKWTKTARISTKWITFISLTALLGLAFSANPSMAAASSNATIIIPPSDSPIRNLTVTLGDNVTDVDQVEVDVTLQVKKHYVCLCSPERCPCAEKQR